MKYCLYLKELQIVLELEEEEEWRIELCTAKIEFYSIM